MQKLFSTQSNNVISDCHWCILAATSTCSRVQRTSPSGAINICQSVFHRQQRPAISLSREPTYRPLEWEKASTLASPSPTTHPLTHPLTMRRVYPSHTLSFWPMRTRQQQIGFPSLFWAALILLFLSPSIHWRCTHTHTHTHAHTHNNWAHFGARGVSLCRPDCSTIILWHLAVPPADAASALHPLHSPWV